MRRVRGRLWMTVSVAAEDAVRSSGASLPPFPSRDELPTVAMLEGTGMATTLTGRRGHEVEVLPAWACAEQLSWDVRRNGQGLSSGGPPNEISFPSGSRKVTWRTPLS